MELPEYRQLFAALSFCRGNKTKTNRQFRQQVLGTGSSQDPSSEVTWTDCQEAIISLQLATGSSVRLCSGAEELAEHVLTLTKAVCNKPFRCIYTQLFLDLDV